MNVDGPGSANYAPQFLLSSEKQNNICKPVHRCNTTGLHSSAAFSHILPVSVNCGFDIALDHIAISVII